jgi:hypothetical protein
MSAPWICVTRPSSEEPPKPLEERGGRGPASTPCPAATKSTQVDSASAATGPTRGGARRKKTDKIFFLGVVVVAATEAVVLVQVMAVVVEVLPHADRRRAADARAPRPPSPREEGEGAMTA